MVTIQGATPERPARSASMEPLADTRPPAPRLPERPRLRKIRAVVNAASGSVGPNAADAVQRAVAAHGLDLTMATPGKGELESAITAAIWTSEKGR